MTLQTLGKLSIVLVAMFIVVGVLCVGAVAPPSLTWTDIGQACLRSFIFGAMVGLPIYILVRSRLTYRERWFERREAIKRRIEIKRRHAPSPFENRLASFAKSQSVDDVASKEPFKSRMPFWSAVMNFQLTPPKSVQVIRALLLRIRRLVRS